MSGSKKQLAICPNHGSKKVPLIYTYAFPGSEYWCPYCGFNCGMFDCEKYEDESDALLKELEFWKEKSMAFLGAKSTIVCSSTMWEGKRISPLELPQEERDRLWNIINAWKYESRE